MKPNKGFPIYFDWIDRLKEIEPDRAFAIICALSDYFKDRADPLERFSGAEKAIVGIMFDQVKRAEKLSETRSANGQLGGFATAKISKSQQTLANDSKGVANSGSNNNNNNNNNNNFTKEEIYKEESTEKPLREEEKEEPEEPEEKKLSAIEKRFNAFWDAYPKKASKIYAFKCFEKLKVSDELLDQMIKAIEAQKKSIEWTKDGGQYIPNPSTWLNQGKWMDEVTSLDAKPCIPRFSNYDADDAFAAALRRSYGDKTYGDKTYGG